MIYEIHYRSHKFIICLRMVIYSCGKRVTIFFQLYYIFVTTLMWLIISDIINSFIQTYFSKIIFHKQISHGILQYVCVVLNITRCWHTLQWYIIHLFIVTISLSLATTIIELEYKYIFSPPCDLNVLIFTTSWRP